MLAYTGGLGVREALFMTQVLIQRCRNMNRDVYLCSIDYCKSFDLYQYENTVKALYENGVDSRHI